MLMNLSNDNAFQIILVSLNLVLEGILLEIYTGTIFLEFFHVNSLVPDGYYFFLMFIYFCETERDRVWVVEGQRDQETESEAGSRHWAISPKPNVELELMSHEIMTSAEVEHLTDRATQEPPVMVIFVGYKILSLHFLFLRILYILYVTSSCIKCCCLKV